MPRTWKAEFGETWDVPAFVRHLVSQGLLEDLSWHNDVSPSFGLIDEEGGFEIRLWVDHPIADLREYQGQKRFMVTAGTSDSPQEQQHEFDELQPALSMVFEAVANHLKRRPEFQPAGAKAWSPLFEQWEEDPAEFLDELYKSFYR